MGSTWATEETIIRLWWSSGSPYVTVWVELGLRLDDSTAILRMGGYVPPAICFFYGDNFVGSAALAEVCALMSAILGLNRDSDLYKNKMFFLLESYPSPPVTSQHFVDIFFSYRQKWYNCNVKNSFEVPGSVSRSGSTLKPTLFASHKSHPSTKKIVEIRRQHFELSC